MRTPKIHSLNALIDFLNKTKGTSIEKHPVSIESLDSNPWLSGFIEADASFQVRTTLSAPRPRPNKDLVLGREGKYPKLECKLEISFIFYPCREGRRPRGEFDSIKGVKSFMQQIAQFLDIPPLRDEYSFKQEKFKNFEKFTLKTQNIRSNEKLINYLNTYPLFSSKFLDYNDFVLALEIFKKLKINKLECDLDNLDLSTFNEESITSYGDLINLIKKRMGHNRTIFIWDHLQNFYSLNNLLSSTSSSSAVKFTQQLKPSVRVEAPASGYENKILNINKNINSSRKYSTSSKTNTSAAKAEGTLRGLRPNLVNIKNINDLKLNNNNMIVSSVVYNNAEEYKDLILAFRAQD